MSHFKIGTTAKDHVINSSPPVNQNGSSAPTSSDKMVSKAEPGPDSSDPMVSGTEPGSNSSDPMVSGAEPGSNISDPMVSGAEPGSNISDPNEQGAVFQGYTAEGFQATSHLKQEIGQKTSEAKKRHPSKRPREDKDVNPPPKKIPSNHSKAAHCITSNEKKEDTGYSNEQISSMDLFLLDSGPPELGLHQRSRPGGVQTRTSHPRWPLIVSGKHSWHLPQTGIVTTIWFRGIKIMTKESDELFLRCSTLEKNLQHYVECLKKTCPAFKGYYLCDRETHLCVFEWRRDRDLDLIVVT